MLNYNNIIWNCKISIFWAFGFQKLLAWMQICLDLWQWCSRICPLSPLFHLKHGAILYKEAEVFSLSIRNPNGRPILQFDWLIHSGLILACSRCFKILQSDRVCLQVSKQCLWTKWTMASGEEFAKKINFLISASYVCFFTVESLSCEFKLFSQIYKMPWVVLCSFED